MEKGKYPILNYLSYTGFGYFVLLVCGIITLLGGDLWKNMGVGWIIFLASFKIDHPGALWKTWCKFWRGVGKGFQGFIDMLD